MLKQKSFLLDLPITVRLCGTSKIQALHIQTLAK